MEGRATEGMETRMTEPAAVIALRELREEIDRSLEWVKREGFIVDYAVIQRGAGGLESVVESSTAIHALLFVRQKLHGLDALIARVEPPPQEQARVAVGTTVTGGSTTSSVTVTYVEPPPQEQKKGPMKQ